ncbi:MAG: hypothetical protein GWP91_04085 [Rhodobacterales bacterium]|nr:hypothetical protein [Rhodobacterales bacterium]
MTASLTTLLFIFVSIVAGILVAGIVVVFVLLGVVSLGSLGFLLFRGLNPDPNKKLPKKVQGALEYRSRTVKGMDPQEQAWGAAAESLALEFIVLPETWMNYGYCVISGEMNGRQVKISVRCYGNLRYTSTAVGIDEPFSLPDEWGPVLSQPARQGLALVEHAPTLVVKDGRFLHEAIGVRSAPARIVQTAHALVDMASGVALSGPAEAQP